MGTWSQSKMATYGEVMLFSAVLMLPGLGVLVVVPDLVADAGLEGELRELLAAAVIQDVDVQFVRRPVHVQRGQCGVPDHLQRFVVGRNKNVDVRPLILVARKRKREPLQRTDGLHVAEQQDQERIDLGAEEQEYKDEVQRRHGARIASRTRIVSAMRQ